MQMKWLIYHGSWTEWREWKGFVTIFLDIDILRKVKVNMQNDR